MLLERSASHTSEALVEGVMDRPGRAMTTRLTYLTFDSLSEGVGLSQVVPYVERLGRRGLDVTLHSFEKHAPPEEVGERLRSGGVHWRTHPFGRRGPAGGAGRVLRGAQIVAGAPLVHARSDLAAASCLLARSRVWIWDMRAFWREERIDMGLLKPGSAEERIMRVVESASAKKSAGMIALSAAAVGIMAERHGGDVPQKARVVPTCVDLTRFRQSALPPPDSLRFLLTGTLNDLYDVPTMIRLVERVRRRRPAELTVLSPSPGRWMGALRKAGAEVASVDAREMEGHIARHHVGLSMRRPDTRVSSSAAVPTKIGEYLACGRPVVVNAGLGDMDVLLDRYRCGVAVTDLSDSGLDRVALELERLVSDPETPARCRALAEEHFDLERGVDELIRTYRQALDRRAIELKR